jgi:hypothetical protein
MTITLNTSSSNPVTRSKYTTSSFGFYKAFKLSCEVKVVDDVILVNNFNTNLEIDLSDLELTKCSMNIATSSFSEEWNKEDDDFWNNY